jgi:thiol-disulfide isomerase/thioredoxin
MEATRAVTDCGDGLMKKYILITPAVIVTFAFLLSCSSSNERGASGKPAPSGQNQTLTGNMPKFMALDIDGNFHTLEQYKGKALILNFWGTWCPPCRRELPDLKKIYSEYKSRGLEIIGLAINDTPDKVRNFARQTGLDWVMLIANQESAQSYQIGNGVPVTIFLNREGKEVSRAIGARDYNYFKNEIEKII